MRLFFIGWSGKNLGLLDTVKCLVEKGHSIVYWTGDGEEAEYIKKNFPETIFHDHLEARLGKPARDIDVEMLPPPGAELLQKLSECESELMMMMNKRFEWMSVYERKRFFYSLVRYWSGVLQKYNPEKIIFPAVPHTVYDFVIYHLAKIFNIPFFMFDWTWVGDRLLVMNDYRIGCTALARELEKNSTRRFSVHDLPEDLKTYYERQTNSKIDSTPPSVNNFKIRYAWKRVYRFKLKFLFESIKNLSLFSLLFKYLVKKFTPNIQDELLSVQSDADLEKPFVYVPLHYQPEGTTSPLGGVFVDQILMVETLASALPKGWLLYVKENPQQWQPRGLNYFSYRYKGYYKTIASIPNVRLIPPQTNTFDLIHSSQAVATVTGTVGWEALLRNKPAIIFGFPWYRHCYGILQVSNIATAGRALQRIQEGFKPDAENTLRYFACFGKVSFTGFFDEYGSKLSSLTAEENNKNFVDILVHELDA